MNCRLAVFVLVPLAVLAVPLSAASASPPPVSVGIKLLQVPASERKDPRAYEYIIDRLPPGTTIHRKFQVADQGRTPARVKVYAAAASISGGSFQFAAGDTQNEMTTWVRVSHPVLNLRPGQAVTEMATIAVPRDATMGEQYGVLWAEVAQVGQGNVKSVSRVGIRIYLSVGPGGSAPSSFTLGPPGVTRTNGHPVVRVPVHNTGGRAVDISGSLSLSGGPGGLRAGPFRAEVVQTLRPGQPGTMVFTGLPDGSWQAHVTLQSGLIIRTGQFTVDLGHVPAARFPVVLTAGLAALAVLTVVAVLLIMRSRRRRPGGDGSYRSGSPAPAGHGSSDYRLT